MVRITEYKLRKTAKNKGIIGYQSKTKKELLRIIYKLKHITGWVSSYGFNKIVKMQTFSLDKLKKIEIMNNLSQNKLMQIAKNRHIKNYQDMLREDLLIALSKSIKSHTELRKCSYNNTEIGETKKYLMTLEIIFQERK